MASVQVALWVVVVLVALAIAFDFMNGFHDAANSIATVVSTGVLRPGQAVIFAAFFNLVAIFVFHLSVAATVGKGIAHANVIDVHVVFGALIGAISWNLATWYYGIPSSSSHALIGSLLGAGVASLGLGTVHWHVLQDKVLLPLVLSPVVGFVFALAIMRLLLKAFASVSPSLAHPLPSDQPNLRHNSRHRQRRSGKPATSSSTRSTPSISS